MRHVLPIAAATVAFWAVGPAAAFESVYTRTQPDDPNCRKMPIGSSWRCRGPAGLSAVFSDEGNVVEIAYGLRGEERNLGGLQWRGAGNPVGRVVEWRLSGRVPFAAILRINVLNPDDRSERFLLVARVGPEGSCRIALLVANQVNANVRARQVADRAGPSYVCKK